MDYELFTLNGYGKFVWPAFIFTFVCCFGLYSKTRRELKKQEKLFLMEYRQVPSAKIEIVRQKKISRKVLSGTFTY